MVVDGEGRVGGEQRRRSLSSSHHLRRMCALLLRSSPRISRNIKVLARCYSSTPDPFKVLFFGRDEFSCLVLKELLGAKGVSPLFICSVVR